MNARQHIGAFAKFDPGAEIDDERKGRKNEERVEADPAMDIERPGRGVEFRFGAELEGVRGDREVVLHRDPRIAAKAELDREPLQRRETGRRLKVRIEAA